MGGSVTLCSGTDCETDSYEPKERSYLVIPSCKLSSAQEFLSSHPAETRAFESYVESMEWASKVPEMGFFDSLRTEEEYRKIHSLESARLRFQGFLLNSSAGSLLRRYFAHKDGRRTPLTADEKYRNDIGEDDSSAAAGLLFSLDDSCAALLVCLYPLFLQSHYYHHALSVDQAPERQGFDIGELLGTQDTLDNSTRQEEDDGDDDGDAHVLSIAGSEDFASTRRAATYGFLLTSSFSLSMFPSSSRPRASAVNVASLSPQQLQQHPSPQEYLPQPFPGETLKQQHKLSRDAYGTLDVLVEEEVSPRQYITELHELCQRSSPLSSPYSSKSSRLNVAKTLREGRWVDDFFKSIESSRFCITIATARGPGHFPLVYVNRAFEEMSGFSRREALGMNCCVLSSVSEFDIEGSVSRELEHRRNPIKVALVAKRKTGETFYDFIAMAPVFESSSANVPCKERGKKKGTVATRSAQQSGVKFVVSVHFDIASAAASSDDLSMIELLLFFLTSALQQQ